jgi:hypothetical protein
MRLGDAITKMQHFNAMLAAKHGVEILHFHVICKSIRGISPSLTQAVPQTLALGLRIKALTCDVSASATGAAGFPLSALGLRISRLLFFCDFAMV